MFFNSLAFFIFFPVVVGLFFLSAHKYRWILLLAASYFFYMCWNPKYILLIVADTVVAYICALLIEKYRGKPLAKFYFLSGVFFNLGLLFVFKYFNFFNDSFRVVFEHFNIPYSVPAMHVLLPVGISFYTFQILSYSIDVYRGEKQAEKHLGIFALYVAFFPQLVAGPIERSTHLLPQFFEKQKFDFARVADGLKLMVWGLFKKMVIADTLGMYVNTVYSSPGEYSSGVLILATFFFAIEVFCDFSGYSDIAVGAAKVLGFNIMNNFNLPYISKSMSEFWHRWHISLSTWILDYLYTPLAFNRRYWGKYGILFSLLVTFTLMGLWHGANWNYIVFGLLHGIALCIESIFRKRMKKIEKQSNPLIYDKLCRLGTFVFWCFSLIFFRAATMGDAVAVLKNIFVTSGPINSVDAFSPIQIIVLYACIIIAFGRYVLDGTIKTNWGWVKNKPIILNQLYYAFLINMIFFFGPTAEKSFIYFQF